MASSPLIGSTTVLVLLLTIFSSLQRSTVSSFEFQVGEVKGWVVPHANDSKLYNDWASENRFKVGDSIRKYSHTHRRIDALNIFLKFFIWFWVWFVQALGTRKIQWWWWVRQTTRNAIPRTPSSSPTLATQSTTWTTLDLTTSSVGWLNTAREDRGWS